MFCSAIYTTDRFWFSNKWHRQFFLHCFFIFFISRMILLSIFSKSIPIYGFQTSASVERCLVRNSCAALSPWDGQAVFCGWESLNHAHSPYTWLLPLILSFFLLFLSFLASVFCLSTFFSPFQKFSGRVTLPFFYYLLSK